MRFGKSRYRLSCTRVAAFALGFGGVVFYRRGGGDAVDGGGAEGFAHGADVVYGVATASADDGGTEVTDADGVLSHLFGGGVVVGVAVYEAREARVGFGDEGNVQPDGGHRLNDAFNFARAVATVAAEGEGVVFFDGFQGLDGADAHHGVAVGVEGHGDDEGEGGGFAGPFGGGADFLEVAHGFDPEHVHAPFGEGGGLFGKGGFDIFKTGFAEGVEDFSAGADGAAYGDRVRGGVGLGAGVAGGGDVEFVDAGLQVVEFEPVAGAAEGVGEDDLGSRFDEVMVHFADAVGVHHVPFFGWVAVGEAHPHEGGAGRAVGEEVGLGFEEGLEGG